jgi:hypothetical protein
MFYSARSHGRTLHAVLHPRAGLNLANDIGKTTWNGPLQRRRNWSRDRARAKNSFYEDEYATATKLKETGIIAPRIKGGGKKPLGDRSRVNLVNPTLASTMPSP